MSRARLSHYAFRYSEKGTSEALIKFLEQGTRYPSLRSLEAFSRAMGMEPENFPEYRLARARRLLSERDSPEGVGLDEALRNLEAVEPVLLSDQEASDLEAGAEGLGSTAGEDDSRRFGDGERRAGGDRRKGPGSKRKRPA